MENTNTTIVKKSDSIVELATALSQFQAEVKQPFKDKTNPFFKSKYVPLENIVEAITKTSGKHGLSFIQFPVNEENKIGIVTILMHKSGEWIETEPIYANPTKQDAQGAGSVITYLKRYSLSAVFGITSDEDDDGNAASRPHSEPKLASDSQRDFLLALIRQKHETKDEQNSAFKALVEGQGLPSAMTEWTSQQISKAIEYLQQ